MNIICTECGTDLSHGQIICSKRRCTKCYKKSL